MLLGFDNERGDVGSALAAACNSSFVGFQSFNTSADDVVASADVV